MNGNYHTNNIKQCLFCEKDFCFFSSNNKRKYCSTYCYHTSTQKPPQKYICTHCKKEFWREEHLVKKSFRNSWNIFCSQKCQRTNSNPIDCSCRVCGKQLQRHLSNIKDKIYCSQKCTHEEQRLNAKWSKKYDKCIRCGTTSIKHGAFGVCKHCYDFRHDMKKRYGINPEEYDKLIKQCEICGEEQSLAIDHDHTTKKFRGILCRNCNTGLGTFKDSTQLLQKAIKYLLQKQPGNPEEWAPTHE